jgi:hypothetical protein
MVVHDWNSGSICFNIYLSELLCRKIAVAV